MDPPAMVSCWIALGDTRADGGPVEHVRGSHLWGRGERPRVFHGPSDYQAEMRAAARAAGVESPEVVPVVVPKGGGAFHHAWTWHGSDTNRSGEARRALVVHAMPEDARFHAKNRGYAYGRYKRFGSVEMDESFFPITWSARGKRSWFIEGYVRGEL
jgi:ectoine hydroxylase-related dioxygenase (phytanoyl-CoA dioxygenase family)